MAMSTLRVVTGICEPVEITISNQLFDALCDSPEKREQFARCMGREIKRGIDEWVDGSLANIVGGL